MHLGPVFNAVVKQYQDFLKQIPDSFSRYNITMKVYNPLLWMALLKGLSLLLASGSDRWMLPAESLTTLYLFYDTMICLCVALDVPR